MLEQTNLGEAFATGRNLEMPMGDCRGDEKPAVRCRGTEGPGSAPDADRHGADGNGPSRTPGGDEHERQGKAH